MRLMVVISALILAPALGFCDDRLVDEYGFSGLEIYKMDSGIFNLKFTDLNNDGVTDFAFINNSRSRVELFRRLSDDEADIYDPTDPEMVNELTYDGRYKKEFIPIEQEIMGMALGRFDNDDVVDVAVVTKTKELIIQYRGHDRKKVRLEGIKPKWYGVVAGDIDHDGRDDLMVVGEKKLNFWLLKGGMDIGKPVVLDHLKDEPYVKILDLNGDGLLDLLYVYFQGDNPYYVRFQAAPGLFGPVVVWKSENIRAFCPIEAPEKGLGDIMAVYKSSGRLVKLGLEESTEPVFKYYPLAKDKKTDSTSYTLADLDNDNMAEVIVADAAGANIKVIKGLGGGGVLTVNQYPSLRDVFNPRIADLNGDGEPELVVISKAEQIIGVCPVKEPLSFPSFFALEGEPAAMATGDINKDGSDDAVIICTKGVGSKKEYILNILHSTDKGAKCENVVIQESGRDVKKNIKQTPEDILLVDINRDGLDDLILFFNKNKGAPVIFFNKGDSKFEFAMGAETPGLGILDDAKAWMVCPLDVDNDSKIELAACSKNLVRFLYLPEGAQIPQAMKQFNSVESSHIYQGCAFGDVIGDKAPELILFESTESRIHIVDEQGLVIKKIDVDRLDFRGFDVVNLNNDDKADILIKGEDRIGILLSGDKNLILKEICAYESSDKKTYFSDIEIGDMNNNGMNDAVLIDSNRESIFIVAMNTNELKHVLKFKVFDEKLFLSGKGGDEPSAVYIREMTGDAKDDLIILVHDKLIIYPQD